MNVNEPSTEPVLESTEPVLESIDPPASHTVIRSMNGAIHVQHFGPEHVVRGSERIIDLAPGCTVVIRHLPESGEV